MHHCPEGLLGPRICVSFLWWDIFQIFFCKIRAVWWVQVWVWLGIFWLNGATNMSGKGKTFSINPSCSIPADLSLQGIHIFGVVQFQRNYVRDPHPPPATIYLHQKINEANSSCVFCAKCDEHASFKDEVLVKWWFCVTSLKKQNYLLRDGKMSLRDESAWK